MRWANSLVCISFVYAAICLAALSHRKEHQPLPNWKYLSTYQRKGDHRKGGNHQIERWYSKQQPIHWVFLCFPSILLPGSPARPQTAMRLATHLHKHVHHLKLLNQLWHNYEIMQYKNVHRWPDMQISPRFELFCNGSLSRIAFVSYRVYECKLWNAWGVFDYI